MSFDKIYTWDTPWMATAATNTTQAFRIPSSPNGQPHLMSLVFEFDTAVASANPNLVGPLSQIVNRLQITIGGEVYMNYNTPFNDPNASQQMSKLDYFVTRAGGASIMRQANYDATGSFKWLLEVPLGIPVGTDQLQAQVTLETGAGGGANGWANNGSTTITAGSTTLSVWGRYGVSANTTYYGDFQKVIFSASETLPVTILGQHGRTMLGCYVSDDTGDGAGMVDEIRVRTGGVNMVDLYTLEYLNGQVTSPFLLFNTAGTGPTSSPLFSQEILGSLYVNLYGITAGNQLTMDVKADGTGGDLYFAPIWSAPIGGGNEGLPPQQYKQISNQAAAATSDDAHSNSDLHVVKSGGNSMSNGNGKLKRNGGLLRSRRGRY